MDENLPIEATGEFPDGARWIVRMGGSRRQCHARMHVRHLLGGVAEIVGPRPDDGCVALAVGGWSFGQQLYFVLSGVTTSAVRLRFLEEPQVDLRPLHTDAGLGLRAFGAMLPWRTLLSVATVGDDGR